MNKWIKALGLTALILVLLYFIGGFAADYFLSQWKQEQKNEAKKSLEKNLENRQIADSTEINIEYVYESSGGFTTISLANTGMRAINTSDISLLYEGDSQEWSFADERKDKLEVGENLLINTSRRFPEEGASSEIRVEAPYESSDSYTCTNTGGSSC